MAAIWNKVYNEGERNTKYFHSLQKRHFNSKTIRNLFADDSTRISTDLEILQEAKNYYESLYTSITDKELSNEYNDIFVRENIEAKLTDDQNLSCEGELSAAECFGSLKTMEIGKFPGTDGLPTEQLLTTVGRQHYSALPKVTFYSSSNL